MRSDTKMLTPREKRESKCLLNKLTDAELRSLKDTITKRQLADGSRQESIRAILEYSQSAAELLRRKKLRRDILFQYLDDCGIVVAVTAEKEILVGAILKHWRASLPSDGNLRDIDLDTSLATIATRTFGATSATRTFGASSATRTFGATSATQTFRATTATRPFGATSATQTFSATSATRTFSATTSTRPFGATAVARPFGATVAAPTFGATSAAPSFGATAAVETFGTTHTRAHFNVSAPGLTANFTLAVQTAQANPSFGFQDNQAFGETFVSWFYKLLNTQNPLGASAEGAGDFGPQHFWEDCSMKLIIVTPEPANHFFTGSFVVSQKLKVLAREDYLLFNPNISREGVKVDSSRHGLQVVMACGTIHQHNNCVGIFEQMFRLLRDPTVDNNWKIKFTQMRLVRSQVTSLPKLTDSFMTNMLAGSF